VYVEVVNEVQPLVPVVDHSNKYPVTEQFPDAVAVVTADHVMLIEVGFMAASGTAGKVIA
jgi:hypothetical protein